MRREGERADERVVHDLEGEHRQRLFVGRHALDLVAGLRIDAADGRHLHRARQIVDDGVEKHLHALVLEGRAGEHRVELHCAGALADQAADGLVVGRVAFQVGFHRRVVELHDGLDQLLAPRDGLVLEVGRNLDGIPLGAQRLVAPDAGVHLDQVDDALEVAFRADRQLQHQRLGAEAVLDHLHAAEEVGADLVHLVDEDHARDFVFVGLAPDRLGLRLHAGIGVEQRDGAVEHAQRALHLDGEVDVARRVDDVEAALLAVAAFPEGGGGRRRDGDAALLLLLHPVHGRGAFVHLAHLVALAGVEEDALRRGGLAGIDVGHDAEVPVVLDLVVASHGSSSVRYQR